MLLYPDSASLFFNITTVEMALNYIATLLLFFLLVRRIFWPMRDEVTGEWKELHNDRFNDLSSSPNIVRMIKSRRIRCTGHGRGVYRVLVEKPGGKRPLGRNRRRWIFGEVGAWAELICLRIGTGGRHL